MDAYEDLVLEADSQSFEGWDFSYMEGRYREGRTSWDFRRILTQQLASVRSYLDMGTGGGEFLSSLGRLPPRACATEGFRPNGLVAVRNLRPLRVDVVRALCDDNDVPGPQRGALPFRPGSFELVSNRHESFVASEVSRVLVRGGKFATQQVGPGDNEELHVMMGVKPSARRVWDLKLAREQLESAGMEIAESGEERVRSSFLDIGAIVYFLKAIPWEVPGFDIGAYDGRLRALDERIRSKGPFEVTTSRFFLLAKRI